MFQMIRSSLFLVVVLDVITLGFSKPCENLLPGLQRMARGVDITSLELFPSDITLTSGFRQSLFEFSCDSSTKWKHPTVENFEFPVPDQIAAVNTVPGGEMNHKIRFHKDVETYKKSLAVQVGLDANTIAYGDYAFSVGYKDAREEILNYNRTVVETSAFVAAVQMDFKPFYAMNANKNFQDYVSRFLTAKYEDTPERYQEFLNTFGTHYFESGMFGGYMLQRTEIENKYLYEANSKEVNANIQASYLKMIGVHVNVDHDEEQKKLKFDQSATTSYYYYGGKTNLAGEMTTEKFQNWWNSVPSDPWLFGGRIKPIENLISDETVKKEMQKAVYVKLTKAYLQELKDTVRMVKRDARDETKLIDELFRQPFPDKAQVKQLKQKVDELVAMNHQKKVHSYLQSYHDELAKVIDYEIFCKKEVVKKCDHEKEKDVMDQASSANDLEENMRSLLDSNEKLYDDDVRKLTVKASEMIHYHHTVPLAPCREKLICNICKAAVINNVDKDTCSTTHIKELVDVHV